EVLTAVGKGKGACLARFGEGTFFGTGEGYERENGGAGLDGSAVSSGGVNGGSGGESPYTTLKEVSWKEKVSKEEFLEKLNVVSSTILISKKPLSLCGRESKSPSEKRNGILTIPPTHPTPFPSPSISSSRSTPYATPSRYSASHPSPTPSSASSPLPFSCGLKRKHGEVEEDEEDLLSKPEKKGKSVIKSVADQDLYEFEIKHKKWLLAVKNGGSKTIWDPEHDVSRLDLVWEYFNSRVEEDAESEGLDFLSGGGQEEMRKATEKRSFLGIRESPEPVGHANGGEMFEFAVQRGKHMDVVDLVANVSALKRRLKGAIGKERCAAVVKLSTCQKVLPVLFDALRTLEGDQDLEEFDATVGTLLAIEKAEKGVEG
ncbi:hypothetical protein HK097_011396, partial [Rhizophlyctis rosea]